MKLSALFLQFNEPIIISEFKSKKKLFEKDYLLLRREYKPLDRVVYTSHLQSGFPDFQPSHLETTTTKHLFFPCH